MVVKTLSSTRKYAQKVLRKYRSHRFHSAFDSYRRFKRILPRISRKDNISDLDVVLEAISYIQKLSERIFNKGI
uniref:BHLH domain-containing protein n=1 Tax=Lepeophtheirus salmonis TaxID=72036 RepID=A0A0K2U8F7_LEPSM